MSSLNLLLILFLTPLAAALPIALVGRQRGAFSAALSVGSSFIQMVATLIFLLHSWDGQILEAGVDWFQLGEMTFRMGFYINNQAALLLFVVTFVGFWIHLFSLGYMREDAARGRYFLGLTIFMFSMTGLVLGSNLFMLFIFWELVGFSSYFLIGHYFGRPAAAAAANKAFIVNRVGDFGFLLGIIWCFWVFGTTELAVLEKTLSANPSQLLTPVSLLLICGVLGKSAQVPLHVWLPDAMEGPTPVSALIHAATMVAAGVYLLGRIHFLYTADALTVIMAVGLTTAVLSAISAFGVRDIKKILAYSTLSQLGYLTAAFALGTEYGRQHPEMPFHQLFGVSAANFHLTTHAFFKALLFLGAGSVIHACHHEQDIFRMGGLGRRLPITFATFLIGLLALSGIPPLAGFWSKDAILYLAYLDNRWVFMGLTATAFLTPLYMGRLAVVAFFGTPKSEAAAQARESSWIMTLPLLVLAVYSAVGGWMWLYPQRLHFLLDDAVLHPKAEAETLMLAISIACGLGGLLTAWFFYRPGATEDRLEKCAPPLYSIAKSRFFFDEIYRFYVNVVQQRVSDVLAFLDQILLSGLILRGGTGLLRGLGWVLRRAWGGSVAGYLYWFLGGLALFALYARQFF